MEQRQVEKHLLERINRNVLKAMERLAYCAPALPSPSTVRGSGWVGVLVWMGVGGD